MKRNFAVYGLFLNLILNQTYCILAQNVGIGTSFPMARLHIEIPSGYTQPAVKVDKIGTLNPFFIILPNGTIGIGITNPDSSAIVEINSNNKGLLIPRLTTAQRNTIVNPSHSLLIFNTDNFCIEAYNDTLGMWLPVSCPVQCNPCDSCILPSIDSIKVSLSKVCPGDSVFIYTYANNHSLVVINTPSDYSVINQGDTSLVVSGMPDDLIVGVCNKCGCETDTISFSLGTAPKILSIVSNSPVCPNSYIYITATTDRQASYTWNIPAGVVAINGTNSDTLKALVLNKSSGGSLSFNLQVCNGCGCSDTSIYVNVVNPTINLSLSGPINACFNDTIVIHAALSGAVGPYNTNWNISPSGLTTLYQDNDSIKIYLSSTGNFYIVGRSCDSCGCAYDTLTINVSNCFRCLTLDVGGNDYGKGIIQTSDGNYVIVGYTNGIGAGNNDIYLAKISPAGNLIWSTTIGGTGDDRGWDVIETQDGGLAIMATTRSFGVGGWDMYVIKTDAYGNVLWAKTVGGGGNETREGSIIELPNGTLVAAGSEWSSGFGAGNTDVYIVAFSQNGNVLWKLAGGSSNGDFASYLEYLDGTNKIVGTGETEVDGNTDKVYVVMADTAGNFQTAFRIGGGGADRGRAIVEYPKGKIVIAGYTKTYGQGNADVYVIKINSTTNNILWTSVVGGTGIDKAYGIVGYKNSYIIAGSTTSYGQGGSDIYIVALDTMNGNILWTKTIGNSGNEIAKDIIIDNMGYIIALGHTDSYNSNNDIYIMRLKGDGTFNCNAQCLTGSGGIKVIGGNKRNGPSTFNSGGNVSSGGSNTGSGGALINHCP